MEWREGIWNLLVNYLGIPAAQADEMSDYQLFATLSFRTGRMMGALVKAGVDLDEVLPGLRKAPGDAVAGGRQGIASDVGDGASEAGLRTEEGDHMRNHNEPDRDPKL